MGTPDNVCQCFVCMITTEFLVLLYGWIERLLPLVDRCQSLENEFLLSIKNTFCWVHWLIQSWKSESKS